MLCTGPGSSPQLRDRPPPRHQPTGGRCRKTRAALILLLFAGVLGAKGQVSSVAVFEVAMRPMIGAGIVAIDHELDPPLLTLMVGVGIPLSFLTLPVWWHFLSFL